MPGSFCDWSGAAIKPGSPPCAIEALMPPDAAWLKPSTPMTDAMPITMPSMESSDRVRFRQMLSKTFRERTRETAHAIAMRPETPKARAER